MTTMFAVSNARLAFLSARYRPSSILITTRYGSSYSLHLCKLRCTICIANKPVTFTSLHGHYGGSFWSLFSKQHPIIKTPLTLVQARGVSSAKKYVSKLLHDSEGFQHIYTGPLKGAVRAIKVFSLCTCLIAVVSAPVFIWFGKATVPLMARISLTSLVTVVGVGTTAILHWLMKGYVLELRYNAQTKMVRVYTLSVFGRRKMTEFHISESGPPPSVSGFSSFQAKGKSYFLHTDVFTNKELLAGLLGSFARLEHIDIVDRKN